MEGMERKKPLKTFGRKLSDPLTPQRPASISKSSSTDSFLSLDENDKLQVKINQVLQDDHLEEIKRKREIARPDFMDELEATGEDDPLIDGPKQKSFKQIHELVQAGQTSQFFDEVEYLVEGLRTGTVKGRLLSLEELVVKIFAEPSFGAKMRAHGMLTRAIEHISGLVEGSKEAREFLALIIIHLCHEIRKLDAFISLEKLCRLAESLLAGEAISSKVRPFLAQTNIFKAFEGQIHSDSLGYWLLAKCSQSVRLGGSTSELQKVRHKFIEHQFDDLALACLDDCSLDSPLGVVNSRWILSILEFIGPVPTVELTWSLCQGLERSLGSTVHSSQLTLLREELGSWLVRLTGPIQLAEQLAKNPNFIDSIISCLTNTLDSSPLISSFINVVHRSEELKDSLRYRDGFLAHLCESFLNRANDHLGLLLVILMENNPSNKAVIRSTVSLESLRRSISALQGALPTEITPDTSELQETLRGLNLFLTGLK